MKAHSIFFLFPALFFSLNGICQETTSRFSSVDSFAGTVKYEGNLDSLTRKLTAPYSDQLFKARAIFMWITKNIAYNCKYYNRYDYKGKEPKTYTCKDDEDCEAKKEAWETKYIDRVVKRKSAVCQGYSMLFKRMCDIAGLKSNIIAGYTRTEYYQVGTHGSLNHSWNSILIDSTYYLLDATWAAGGCAKDEDGKLLFFQKDFDEYYWLTPYKDFARNHCPKDPVWTLIPNYTLESFATNPYYDLSEISRIKLILPSSGIIDAKKGDTTHFKIAYQSDVKELQINSNIFRNPDIWVSEKVSRRKTIRRYDSLAVKQQQYVPYRRDGNLYEFDYVVTNNALYFLDILCDKKRIMRFNVNVTD
jgi:hypothetical protein